MIARMPVVSNSAKLIAYLTGVFTSSTDQRRYYKNKVKEEVACAIKNGWLPIGFDAYVDYVMNDSACIRSCVSGGAPDALVDWVAAKRSAGLAASHLSYISRSEGRVSACSRNTLDYIVDTMMADAAFNPPYTPDTDQLYQMLFN